jgi:hypothetical protein
MVSQSPMPDRVPLPVMVALYSQKVPYGRSAASGHSDYFLCCV